MRSLRLSLAAACFSSCALVAHGYPLGEPDDSYKHRSSRILARNIVYNGAAATSYDYVIVGGGTAGLVLASRLSEDSNMTVLVLEAGDTGDAVKDKIDIPGDAYYSGLLGTSYDYAYPTVAQPNAGGRTLTWPRGKVLGGSSAVNGMYMVRPSALEYDTWAGLVAGQDGADAWKWDYQFQSLKKAETFTPPSSDLASQNDLLYSMDSHGTSGPVHTSWPGFELPITGNWSKTLQAANLPIASDPYGGDNWGGFVALNAINPSNFTRSYARSAYIDPLPPRANLDVLPNATVTRIIFNTSNSSAIKATSVEFAASSSAARQTVTVNKEVILAGGAIGSPHVLMHSGIGPKDVLTAAGVDVVLELPGVGQHLQDHISTGVTWTTNADTAASLRDGGAASGVPDGQSSAFLSYVNGGEVYVNFSSLFDDPQVFAQNITTAMSTYVNSVPSTYSEVKAGYEAIYNATTSTFLLSSLGHVELLLSANGQPGSQTQSIEIQAALQHPFSQGRLWITSSDPFVYPSIDPMYLSHNADLVSLREALKLARKLGQTAPISNYLLTETSPGSTVQSDSDWENWLANQIGTEFHPAMTCAMLPKEQGGVVDAKLVVYGTQNVRVVDASVFPLQFAAHLQFAVYGLAETAAEIVRAHNNGTPEPGSTTTTTSSSSSPTSTSSSSQSNTNKSAATALSPSSRASALVAGLLIFSTAFTTILL